MTSHGRDGRRGFGQCARRGGWSDALDRRLDELPAGAALVILVHGFRFTASGARAVADPQTRLYRAEPTPPSPRRRPPLAAWPHGLGFSEDCAADGLCVAFGWDGRRKRLASLAWRGRNDFALVYEAAGIAGLALARVAARIGRLRPDLRVSAMAHSLGARVVLQAVRAQPDLNWGRILLLGGAEYAADAEAALALLDRAGGGAEIVNVVSRANDLYDGLFELFAPSPGRPGDRPLGVRGLGRAHPRWLDLQLDHPALRPWLATRGLGLARRRETFSHWHFYGDPGAMSLWERWLRGGPDWSLAALRAALIPETLEPRWARLAPRIAIGSRLALPRLPEPDLAELPDLTPA